MAEHYPISCHGIGLSLGSADPLCFEHLSQLVQLIEEIQPFVISDHLSWSSIDGKYTNDLLPLPYTEEALNNFCTNVEQVQDFLGRQLLIENPSSYLHFHHSTIPEWEFLQQVQQRTGSALLLDVNNIYVSACNHGFDSNQYLAALDPTTVQEIHLAGFTVKKMEGGKIWIDTHSKPVSEPVWDLYRRWIQKNGSDTPTLIEWDLNIPELDVLLVEANKAKTIVAEQARLS